MSLTTPTRNNRYQLPSWPPTEFTVDLWNAVLGDLADRVTDREQLEATFETLKAQGIQASLDYIQINVAPQIVNLQQSITLAQNQIDQIIIGGKAPDALKFGGQLPAYYATASALADGLAGKVPGTRKVNGKELSDDITLGKEDVGLGKADNTADADKPISTDQAAALAKRVRVDVVQNLSEAEKGRVRRSIGAGVLAGFRDKLINGNGQHSYRTYTTVADDFYWCDRHYVLTQSAAITPSIIADVADGIPYMMRLTQSQAAAQRMGNAQIVESAVAKPMRGKRITLGGKLRSSSAQTVRFAVLEWVGTADVVTSDVVANWTSVSFTAGGFFLVSNLAVAAVGSVALAANTVTDWSLLADISSACNNLIVFCWTEGAVAQGTTVDMVWGLVEGDATAEKWPYEVRHPQQEIALCQRYYENIALRLGGDAFAMSVGEGRSISGTLFFKQRKRGSPTILTNISGGNFSNLSAPPNAGAWGVGCTGVGFSTTSGTVSAILYGGSGDYLVINVLSTQIFSPAPNSFATGAGIYIAAEAEL